MALYKEKTMTAINLNTKDSFFCDEKGVAYNNKDNRDNKENKDNIEHEFSSSSLTSAATPPQANHSNILPSSQEGAKPINVVATAEPTPHNLITTEFVHRALFTLFDNGENSNNRSHQRYKFQATINPANNPSSKHEFIGSLTKDLRNFKKYLPEGINYEDIKYLRKHIKDEYGAYPYLGKLHYNEGRKAHSQRNSNEPYCFVAVYWNSEEQGWDFILQMYEWIHRGSLYDTNLTKAQRAKNVKATEIWFNKQYEHSQITQRNRTFADRMR